MVAVFGEVSLVAAAPATWVRLFVMPVVISIS
jgi:hypothetical protein